MSDTRMERCGRDRRKGDRRRKQEPFAGPEKRRGERRSGRDRRLEARVARHFED